MLSTANNTRANSVKIDFKLKLEAQKVWETKTLSSRFLF